MASSEIRPEPRTFPAISEVIAWQKSPVWLPHFLAMAGRGGVAGPGIGEQSPLPSRASPPGKGRHALLLERNTQGPQELSSLVPAQGRRSREDRDPPPAKGSLCILGAAAAAHEF